MDHAEARRILNKITATNYYRLALDHRILSWITILQIALHIAFFLVGTVISPKSHFFTFFAAVWFASLIIAAGRIQRITHNLGTNGMIAVALAGFAFIPFICLLPLIGVTIRCHRLWRSMGLEPTLIGIDPEIGRALQEDKICIRCGYNLEGNQSGVCPECGRRIDDAIS